MTTPPNSAPGGSDLDLALQQAQLVAGQGQVGLVLVQRQVEEEAEAGAVVEQADEVVLGAEGDQDVLDAVVQAEGFHGAQLGPDDLGVAGCGDVEVEAGTAGLAEGHAA